MFKTFFNKVFLFLKKIYNGLKERVVSSFLRARNGEENLNIILYYWSLIPCVIYFISLKFVNSRFLLEIFDVIILLLTILDLYFIARTLEVHPEYDSELVKEKERQEYYNTLTKEELEKVKKQERKNNINKTLKKYILLKTDDKVDLFKIIRLFVIITLLIAIKRILL